MHLKYMYALIYKYLSQTIRKQFNICIKKKIKEIKMC